MALRAQYVAALALALGTALPAAAQQASPLDQPGLREYVTQVLARNAALAAASSDLEAAVERIRPAGALPDPILSFGMMSVPVPSFDFDEEAMTQLPVGLRQVFPFPGKQGARTAVARGDSAVTALGIETTTAILAAEAAAAFFELAYASTALEVWRHRVELADQALRTARTRYQTGQVPQTDLLRAELRRARLAEEGHRFAAEVEAAAARADAFRGGPGDSIRVPGLARPDSVVLQAALRDTLTAREQLTQILHASNPLLRQAAAHVDRARASARVFAIAARPDFAVGLQTGIRFGGREPFLTAIVGISVPLWAGRKQSPAARASTLEVRSSEQRYDDLQVRLEAALAAQVASLTGLRERIEEVSERVLPLAEAASFSALRSYGVGVVELTAALETQDELFQVELEFARLLSDYGAQRAALSALLGEEWYR